MFVILLMHGTCSLNFKFSLKQMSVIVFCLSSAVIWLYISIYLKAYWAVKVCSLSELDAQNIVRIQHRAVNVMWLDFKYGCCRIFVWMSIFLLSWIGLGSDYQKMIGSDFFTIEPLIGVNWCFFPRNHKTCKIYSCRWTCANFDFFCFY